MNINPFAVADTLKISSVYTGDFQILCTTIRLGMLGMKEKNKNEKTSQNQILRQKSKR